MNFALCNPERQRLEALRTYQILDTVPEKAFDDLAFLAAEICQTPIALVNLIDSHRQWFKAKVGLNIEQMPRELGFCPICIQQSQPLIIPDTLADEQYANSLVVIAEPNVRFYAGVPLIAPGGEAIGTICVVDRVPRQISDRQIASLQALSSLAIRELEMRRSLLELASIKAEFKQAQQAQYQSESTLRSFFDSAPMMMGIVELLDNDIRHISDNLAAAKFLGLTPNAMQNRREREMGVPDEQIVKWLDYYQQAAVSQSPVKFEYAVDTPQGKTWLSATVSAIAQSNTKPLQFAYVIEDISNRKQAEDELRWTEALLRSMTSVSPLAFYVVNNRTDDILYFNDRFCEIWGIEHLQSPMAERKLKNQDIIPDCLQLIQDIPAFAASCTPLQSEEYRCVIEDEIAFNDGRTIRRFSSQVRDRLDQYFGRLYIFEDITTRKQVEQQIREQAALLDISTDAIVLRDLSNKILLWNKSAEQLYEWTAAEAIDKTAHEIFSNEPLAQYLEICQTVIQQGSWEGELEKISKFGREIIVASRWMLVRDEHLEPKSILIVDTDITKKKQLEKKFLRAQRMESIGTLASGIAHDLNNVLSPILMSVQLLKMKASGQQIEQMLSIVETNVKRGANLVKQVLSFVRGIEGDRRVLQIKQIIDELQQIIQETFPKTISLTTELAADLFPVYGDSTQLHQVLINLCLNARDAMPDGGTITIAANNIYIDEIYSQVHFEAQVGHYLVLTITDTGFGIPSELLDKIFEPFFTTKEFGYGTGLGLSTAIGIIKGHGGFINVSSSLGKGTTFKVYLPAVNTVAIPIPEDSEMPNGNGEWLLVVDDESAIREVTKASLESYNYKIISASDGIDAIALYARNQDKIKVAIIDMMMPKMDGATTIATLHGINPELPMIAVSGLATSEQVPIDKTLQHTAFLSKPYTVQELLKTLHLLLTQK
ncbi:PAS domain S-box protein [Calothrix sp. FACHB-1219]|uniref:hybrid sensor histidine kinase/response regulator n=1 Tax=unclassified Calothrix TaxID=2619626 RepID=UPI0016857F5E|nr:MULTISPECIES: PAS domain S-box protein [unclassified Calothrix]MBD2203080.1 PAS domain S-box protein [Calothrix sp. FACHB-168]MBD2218681.1 PAS domain S-box protein [Calothrix sp. FACHB-1219]